MKKDSRIYVAGHLGLAGSALVRSLERHGFSNFVFRSQAELDLQNQSATNAFFASERPEHVFLAAAKVGGIQANNTYPADFIRDNLQIQTNVIDAAYRNGVKRLLFLGSSCIYPRDCPQPIREEYLLTGPLEATNRAYALAKIAGIEMCWSYNRQYGTRYLAAMPTNMYGPGDNYDLETSHVLPALIRKVYEARRAGRSEVVVWGTGKPLREFLFSSDFADACVHLMTLDDQVYETLLSEKFPPLINVGYGSDVSIRELAETVCRVLGFTGSLVFDASRPDGTPRKLMDSSRLRALGWTPKIDLETGIRLAFEAAKPILDRNMAAAR
ncbi:MAG TPA: GDP-L-fucose synthase [Terracidiphilus sp.]|nr:GDP-L-fucose synthase [Terracidiphilus sp.]